VDAGQGSSVHEPGKDVVASVEVVDPASTESGILKQKGCRDNERRKSNGIRLENQTFLELLVGLRGGFQSRWRQNRR
jgi:hypothetical protein